MNKRSVLRDAREPVQAAQKEVDARIAIIEAVYDFDDETRRRILGAASILSLGYNVLTEAAHACETKEKP